MIGKRIKEIRKIAGYTQDAIAKHGGISRSTVNDIERGAQRPSIDFLIKFAELTNISLDELTGLKQENPHYSDIYILLRELEKGCDQEKRTDLIKRILTITRGLINENESLKNDMVDIIKKLS